MRILSRLNPSYDRTWIGFHLHPDIMISEMPVFVNTTPYPKLAGIELCGEAFVCAGAAGGEGGEADRATTLSRARKAAVMVMGY
jgi:hypothetical protein